MKPDIHPAYHDVIFIDSATGEEWVTRSAMTSKETRDIEGVEVPVVRLEISSRATRSGRASFVSWMRTERSTASASGTAQRSRNSPYRRRNEKSPRCKAARALLVLMCLCNRRLS